MAQDLIPPPSPAGRPSGPGGVVEGLRGPPGSEPVVPDPLRAAPARALATGPPPRLPADSPHRVRFGFLLGALIGLGIAAAALTALVLAGGTEQRPALAWSSWRPAAKDGLDAAVQVAEHVGREYRLANGDQLVGVEAGQLAIADTPVTVAIRTAARGGNIQFVNGAGVLFTLNGLGPRGSIRGGTASTRRHLLLRREALELALYSFRYISGIEQVVVLLPPPPVTQKAPASPAAPAPSPTGTPDASAAGPPGGQGVGSPAPTQAIYFRARDLATELALPLPFTLSPIAPLPETIGGPEAAQVDRITRTNLFTASFITGQNAKAYLVLDRLH